jgi:hypothetical protein
MGVAGAVFTDALLLLDELGVGAVPVLAFEHAANAATASRATAGRANEL